MENFLQVQFHLDKVKEADFRAGRKGDQHIHVAVGAEIFAQDGAKQRKFHHPPAAAEFANLFARNAERFVKKEK